MHRSNRGSALTALLGLAMGAVSLVAIATLFLAVKKQFGGIDTGPVVKTEPKTDPKSAKPEAKPEVKPDEKTDVPPPKPVDEPPQFKAAAVQVTIERTIGRVNFMSIIAHLLEMQGRTADGRRVRDQVMAEAGRVGTLIGMYERARGTEKFEYLRADDQIQTFDGMSLKERKLDAEGQMSLFVVSIKSRPKATVGLLRANAAVTFTVTFKEPPADWLEFASLLIEDEAVAVVPADPVKPTDPTKPPVVDPVKPPPVKPPVNAKVDAAVFKLLFDGTRRTDVNARGPACAEFKKLAQQNPTCAGWFSAARYFLEGDDAFWGVDKGPGAQALADYFTSQKVQEILSFTAERHLAAASSLASKARERKSGEVFRIFAMGHIADAAARMGASDGRVRTAAESCGLLLTDDKNRWGDALGVSVASIMYWMGMNQQQKALDVYGKFKSQGDDATRFAAAFAEFSLALSKQTYDWETYHKKLMEFQKVCKDPEDAAYFEMLAQMARSIAGCLVCRGGTAMGCNVCMGSGESARNTCPSCKGASAGAVDDRYRKSGGQVNCSKCSNTGYVLGKCVTCKGSGKTTCDSCHGKGWKSSVTEGSIWNLFNRTDCWRCQGSGTVIPGAACRCGHCRGLGYALTPKR